MLIFCAASPDRHEPEPFSDMTIGCRHFVLFSIYLLNVLQGFVQVEQQEAGHDVYITCLCLRHIHSSYDPKAPRSLHLTKSMHLLFFILRYLDIWILPLNMLKGGCRKSSAKCPEQLTRTVLMSSISGKKFSFGSCQKSSLCHRPSFIVVLFWSNN